MCVAEDQALSVCNADHTSCLAASGYIYTAGSISFFKTTYCSQIVKLKLCSIFFVSGSKLRDMICVTVMKTSDLNQRHKPKTCPKEIANHHAVGKIATDQALFNLCQDTLSCFVLYIQHKQISEQWVKQPAFCHPYQSLSWCYKCWFHHYIYTLWNTKVKSLKESLMKRATYKQYSVYL